MPVPSEPYIIIQTGEVKGTITEGLPFSWYNSASSGSCTITGVSNWCTLPNNVVNAGMSQAATALEVTGDFGYTCPCVQAGPSPIIVVHPVHMERKSA